MRELTEAAQIVREEAWDHTADIIAHLGSAMTGKPHHRSEFHPFMERRPFNLDDPGATHDRLVRQQERG